MKFMLKAPGTKRLKLKHDYRPSSFALDYNLRRYNTVEKERPAMDTAKAASDALRAKCDAERAAQEQKYGSAG